MTIAKDPNREALTWLEGVRLAHEHWIPRSEEWIAGAALSEPMTALLKTLLPRWKAQSSIMEETAAAIRILMTAQSRPSQGDAAS